MRGILLTLNIDIPYYHATMSADFVIANLMRVKLQQKP